MKFFLWTLIFSFAGASAHAASFTWDRPVGFIETGAYESAPKGFLNFCKRHPADCPATDAPRYVVLDGPRMKDLNTVNTDVIDYYTFNTDLQGRDKWQYPTDGYGDCEDLALEKRRRLIELGWPASALLLTLAERKGEELDAWRYHVTLTVRTAQGDYILDDNIRSAVSWDKAARLYRFIALQSPQNPHIWMKVAPAVDASASVDSGSFIR